MENETEKFMALYIAVNEMMCELGAQGSITTRDEKADKVMSALFDIDGGVYDTKKVFTGRVGG